VNTNNGGEKLLIKTGFLAFCNIFFSPTKPLKCKGNIATIRSCDRDHFRLSNYPSQAASPAAKFAA